MQIEIEYLADHQNLVPTVTGWLFAEWGRLRPTNSLAAAEARLRTHLNRDRLPLTLVALRGEECIGTASLRERDLDDGPSVTPWLSSVFVAPSERGQGIGSQLVAAAEGRARALGFDRLYLHTPDRVSLYVRLGWTNLDNLGAETIMTKKLAPNL